MRSSTASFSLENENVIFGLLTFPIKMICQKLQDITYKFLFTILINYASLIHC